MSASSVTVGHVLKIKLCHLILQHEGLNGRRTAPPVLLGKPYILHCAPHKREMIYSALFTVFSCSRIKVQTRKRVIKTNEACTSLWIHKCCDASLQLFGFDTSHKQDVSRPDLLRRPFSVSHHSAEVGGGFFAVAAASELMNH